MKNTYIMDEAEGRKLGLELGGQAEAGAVIALVGDMGAGKTTLAKAIAEGLGIRAPVTSPTFTLVHEYGGGRLPMYHFDAYRIGSPDEIFELGFEEYIFGGGVSVVEWADLIEEIMPPSVITVEIAYCGEGARSYTISHGGE